MKNIESRQSQKLERKHRKKRKRRIFLGLLLIFVAGIVFFLFRAFGSFSNMLEAIHNDVETISLRDKEVKTKSSDPISILLLGVDYGEEESRSLADGGRTDTMLVLTINPKTKSTTLVSLPRDTYAEIIGHNTYEKINHAYAYGGAAMSINTVQNLLQVPIDYYVEVSMDGMKGIVDAIGGIDIYNDFDFTFDDLHFPVGEQHLDGMFALAYSRMRYEDPNGDFGRQVRQQKVIKAILQKAISLDSIMNYQSVFDTLENNVRTNLTMNDLIDLQQNYLSSVSDFTQETLHAHDMYVDDLSTFYISKQELLRISNQLRRSLNLNELTYDEFKSLYVPGMSETFDGLDKDDNVVIDTPYYYRNDNGELYETTGVFGY